MKNKIGVSVKNRLPAKAVLSRLITDRDKIKARIEGFDKVIKFYQGKMTNPYLT